VSADTWTHSQATAATIGEIAATLTGEIVTPDDPGWDEARLGWNLAADREPAFVAIPAEVADVVALVGFETPPSLPRPCHILPGVGTSVTDHKTDC
jgi:hypothetical protein